MTDIAKLTVTLTEPVAVVRHLRNDFRQESYDYIPGSVLRGALAALWLLEHGEPNREFVEIFEGDGVFGPLHAAASLPVPLSVKVHKYKPGDDCKHLWWDVAMLNADEKEPEACDQCKQKLEFSKGTPVGRIRRTPRTRAELDSEGSVRKGNLFNQSSIAAGNVFTGWVYGPAVRALTIGGEPARTLSLGGKRTVQGNAEVSIDFGAAPEPVERNGKTLILRLASPGIFVDDLGLPADTPDLRELRDVLDVGLERTGQWERWTEVGGWHLASGLPKPTERAIQAGSTYRFRCTQKPSEDALSRLMARGIGLRRREGFGALCIPEPPMSREQWKGPIAALWRSQLDLEKVLVPLLEKRIAELKQGNDDRRPFRAQLDHSDEYARALRKLLDVTDPVLLDRLMRQFGGGK